MAVQGDLIETYRESFSRSIDPQPVALDPYLDVLALGSSSSVDISGGVLLPKTTSGRWIVPTNFPSSNDLQLADAEVTVKVNVGSDVSSYGVAPFLKGTDINNYMRFRIAAGSININKVMDGSTRTLSSSVTIPGGLTPNTSYWLRGIASGNQLTAQIWTSAPPASGGSPLAEANFLVADSTEIQTLTMTGTPTGGTFTLETNAANPTVPTPAINWNATAAQVRTALEAVYGVGNVAVTGGPFPGATMTVTWQGAKATEDIQTLQIATNSLTGGTTPTVNVVATQQGLTASRWGAGGLGRFGLFISGTSMNATPNPWTFDDLVVREPLMPYTYWGNLDEQHDGTSVLLSRAGIETALGEAGLLTRSQVVGAFSAYDLRAGTAPWTRTNFVWKKKR